MAFEIFPLLEAWEDNSLWVFCRSLQWKTLIHTTPDAYTEQYGTQTKNIPLKFTLFLAVFEKAATMQETVLQLPQMLPSEK